MSTELDQDFLNAAASARSKGIFSIDAGNGYTPEERKKALPDFEKANKHYLKMLNKALAEGKIPAPLR